MTAYRDDRFIYLPELGQKCGGKSAKHMRKVAQSQNGMYSDDPILSQKCIRSYPPLIKGPGGKWGTWESTFVEWREREEIRRERMNG